RDESVSGSFLCWAGQLDAPNLAFPKLLDVGQPRSLMGNRRLNTVGGHGHHLEPRLATCDRDPAQAGATFWVGAEVDELATIRGPGTPDNPLLLVGQALRFAAGQLHHVKVITLKAPRAQESQPSSVRGDARTAIAPGRREWRCCECFHHLPVGNGK